MAPYLSSYILYVQSKIDYEPMISGDPRSFFLFFLLARGTDRSHLNSAIEIGWEDPPALVPEGREIDPHD